MSTLQLETFISRMAGLQGDGETLAARDREAFIRVAVVDARTCSRAWRWATHYRNVFGLVLTTLFPGGFVIPDWGRVVWRYGMANAILDPDYVPPRTTPTEIDSDSEASA